MAFDFQIVFAIILAYLVGSISAAILVAKVLRLPDPRTVGSKNPGATNVMRFAGKKAAIITLLGDAFKGAICVWVAMWAGLPQYALAWVAFAAFLGHLYPMYFDFRGGKGVATALGCVIALVWPVGLLMLITWILVAALFRYSSLAAVVMAILAPFYMAFFSNLDYTAMMLVMSVFLIVRHKQNIYNLFAGKESKIGKKTTSPVVSMD